MSEYIKRLNINYKSQYEFPFFLDDRMIDYVAFTANCIEKYLFKEAHLLATKQSITYKKALSALLNAKMPFPTLNRVLQLPSIEDIAGRIKEWVEYIDDDKDSLPELSNYHHDNNFGLSFFQYKWDSYDDVVNGFLGSKHIQYWVDIGLPNNYGNATSLDIGEKLLEFMLKNREKRKLPADIIVFTHFPEEVKRFEGCNKDGFTLVQKDDISALKKTVNTYNNKLKNLLKSYKCNPFNPILAESLKLSY